MDFHVNDATSTIPLLDELLNKAIELKVSDIHLEPKSKQFKIKFRIDGLLQEQEPISLDLAKMLVARIKLLANLDITEKRIPQDGKFSFLKTNENFVDLRIATFPTLYGEKLVIRILDVNTYTFTLDQVGFDGLTLETVRNLCKKSYGFFLVAGPTGSGKTTTLHAMLKQAHTSSKNSVTLEDPIEYTLEDITQTQINSAIGLSFDRGLRSVLRQDPDIILVGEIRDKETAQAALQASITGHLVLSTIHTNDAVTTILRLLDMGIEHYFINAALTAIISQRLARKLCNYCKYQEPIQEQEKSIIQKLNLVLTYSYKSNGCFQCNFIGYKGRIGIFELLVFTQGIRSLITQKPDFDSLFKQACREGMHTIIKDCENKIKEGIVSLQEIIRVIL